jgi:hypothetical protein
VDDNQLRGHGVGGQKITTPNEPKASTFNTALHDHTRVAEEVQLERVKSYLVGCCLLLSSWGNGGNAVVPSRAGDVVAANDYEASLSTVLKAAVDADGSVDYDLLRRDSQLSLVFRQVLKAVEDYDDALVSDQQKLAFWINAYNVQMLQSVIEHPETQSVLDEGMADYFFKTKFRTARRDVSLDEIEHAILRADQKTEGLDGLSVEKLDPRIHVGLNCAAVSCPALQREAFVPERIEQQLDRAMKQFANAPRHFRIDGSRVIISSLLDWFADDWDSVEAAGDYLLRFMDSTRPWYVDLQKYLRGTSAEELKKRPETRFEYDWTINASR